MNASKCKLSSGVRSSDDQDALFSAPECLDQSYIDSLMDCFELLTTQRPQLLEKAHAKGLETQGKSDDEIAQALYRGDRGAGASSTQ